MVMYGYGWLRVVTGYVWLRVVMSGYRGNGGLGWLRVVTMVMYSFGWLQVVKGVTGGYGWLVMMLTKTPLPKKFKPPALILEKDV